MGSFLDGMAASLYAGFRGKLRSGVILRQAFIGDGLDGHGRPVSPTSTATPCEGFTEGYSAFTRAQAGIPADDLRVNLFSASMPGFTPSKDDVVRLDLPAGAKWYKLRGRATDPATVLWECQAFELPLAEQSRFIDLLAELANVDLVELAP